MRPATGTRACRFPPLLPHLIGAAVLLFVGVYEHALAPVPEPTSKKARAWVKAAGRDFMSGDLAPPRHAVVSVSTDRRNYYLGENPPLRLTVTNHGSAPFQITFGGDYRGTTRPLRFRVTAYDAHGRTVPDPFPPQLQPWMGGMGGLPLLQPGESQTLETSLMRHADIRDPGVYQVDVRHDLGWRADQGAALPGGSVAVKFVEPSEAEAREIMARTRTDDFGSLRFAVYLPLLAREAQNGRVDAVTGVGNTPGVAATALLIRLGESASATGEVRKRALWFLVGRCPGGRCPHLVVAGSVLAPDAWNDATKHAALALARGSVVQDQDADMSAHAAELIAAFGDERDVSPLLRLLETNLAPPAGPDEPLPPGQERLVSAAARALVRLRSWAPDAEEEGAPRSDAERYMLLLAASRDEAAASPAIEALAAASLAHPSPVIAQQAFYLVLHPVSEDRLPIVRSALFSRDWRRVSAALQLLRRTGDVRLNEELLAWLDRERDPSRFGLLLSGCAGVLGSETLFPRLIARLADPDPAFSLRVHDELIRLSFEDRGRRHLNPSLGPADFERLRAMWEKFFNEHRERLARGRKLSPTSRDVPAELFAGRFLFEQKPRRPFQFPDWLGPAR